MHDSFLRHYISQLSVVLCHGEPPGRLLLRESPVQAGPMRALVLSFSLWNHGYHDSLTFHIPLQS